MTWQEFFRRRALRNAEIEARETPVERQRRLQRTRQPGVTRAKHFEWELGDIPGDRRLFRRAVIRNRIEDVREEYSPNQRRYDPYRNEWDYCYEFGPSEDDGDDVDADGDADFVEDPPPRFQDALKDPIRHPSPPPTYEIDYHPPPSPVPEIHDTEAWEPPVFGLTQALHRRFGFVLPSSQLPAGQRVIDRTSKEWHDVVRIAGLRPGTDELPPPANDVVIVDFISDLRNSRRPGAMMWDLHEGNPRPVTTSWWFSRLRKLARDVYYFDFTSSSPSSSSSSESEPRHKYIIALHRAADVLDVCRQDRLTQYQLGQYLVNHGVPFCTLVPLPQAERPPMPQGFSPQLEIHTTASRARVQARRRRFTSPPSDTNDRSPLDNDANP